LAKPRLFLVSAKITLAGLFYNMLRVNLNGEVPFKIKGYVYFLDILGLV
jgi:hypothetical protein